VLIIIFNLLLFLSLLFLYYILQKIAYKIKERLNYSKS